MDILHHIFKMEKRLALTKHFDCTIKIDFGNKGIIYIDGNARPPKIHQEDLDAELSLTTDLETINKIENGELAVPTALLLGKIQWKGQWILAAKLKPLLE